MQLINSLIARFDGVMNDLKSHYGEYIKHYKKSPVQEKSILFESFGGKNFQGNTFYVYKEIFERQEYLDFKLFISALKPNQIKEYLRNRGLFDQRVVLVTPNTKEYRQALATSKYLVNNVSFNMDFIKKTEQVYLNTWHGTPLKTLGRRILNEPFAITNTQRNFLLADRLIAPNEFTKNVYLQDYCVDGIMTGDLVLQGYPRNAVFFNQNSRRFFKERYQLNGYKTVLYMPTWRGTSNGVSTIDVFSDMEKLAVGLGKEYKIFVKLHPAMAEQGRTLENIYYAPTDCEIYEFLNAVDILITDYSSVFFDFASTGKPIILYQYDKEGYFSTRGTYEKALEKIPFTTVYNLEDLGSAVKKCKKVDYSDFVSEFCPYDGIDSAKDAVKTLFEGQATANGKAVDVYVIDFTLTDKDLLDIKRKLDQGKEYLFLFFKSNRKVSFVNLTCFNQINYSYMYKESRLLLGERIKYGFASLAYTLTKSKIFERVLERYVRREQIRLFGYTKIGNIYTKGKRKPVLLRLAKKWEL